MRLNKRFQECLRFSVNIAKPFRIKKVIVILRLRHDRPIGVVHPRQATSHARTKVNPDATKNNRNAAGHVLAAVVADALNNGRSSRIPDRKPLARAPRREKLPRGRAVQGNITQNHVLSAVLGGKPASADYNLTAREALADEVVGLAIENQLHPVDRKGSERLPRRAVKIERHVRRKLSLRPAQRQLTRQPCSYSPIAIGDR